MSLTDIQQKILEIIESSLNSGGSLSMRAIGEEVDITANSVFYHIQKLEEKGILVRDGNGKVVRINSPSSNHAVAFLPLLGNAACGAPLDQVVDENTVRMIPVPLFLLGRNSKKHLYLVRANGDSMSPKIEDGDFVAFEPNRNANNGDIVVARTSQGFTIKVYSSTQSQLLLKPLNPRFEPLVFEVDATEKFDIDGVAVGVIKSEQNLKEVAID